MDYFKPDGLKPWSIAQYQNAEGGDRTYCPAAAPGSVKVP
jgi:hypothetical protein